MNGKMSWMGGGVMPWEQEWNNGNGDEEENKTKKFFDSLRPMKSIGLRQERTIELSTRYKALEREEEEEEIEQLDEDDDEEPGNMLKPEDPDSTADRVCPFGGIRNWFQRNCECGMAIYWPVEEGEDLDGFHRCKGYIRQRGRWKRAIAKRCTEDECEGRNEGAEHQLQRDERQLREHCREI